MDPVNKLVLACLIGEHTIFILRPSYRHTPPIISIEWYNLAQAISLTG